jgi:hypothetical protein
MWPRGSRRGRDVEAPRRAIDFASQCPAARKTRFGSLLVLSRVRRERAKRQVAVGGRDLHLALGIARITWRTSAQIRSRNSFTRRRFAIVTPARFVKSCQSLVRALRLAMCDDSFLSAAKMSKVTSTFGRCVPFLRGFEASRRFADLFFSAPRFPPQISECAAVTND